MPSMKLSNPSRPAHKTEVDIGALPPYDDQAAAVMFDVHATIGSRNPNTEPPMRTYSNISPADARRIALALLRAASKADGRPLLEAEVWRALNAA